MVYYLPYAESLFTLTLAIASWGLVKKKYWIFFIGAYAFAMTRPAVLIFIFAIIGADLRYLFVHRNFNYFFKEVALKALPFALGYFTVTLILYVYCGSWTAYFDARTFWPTETGF